MLLAFFAFSVAEWACWVAVLVWAYERDGVGAASVVSVVQLVPAVLVAPFAATLGDRLRRSVALAVGYAAQGASMLGTGALLALDAPFWVVAAGAAVVTCAVTLTRPVHNALLPSLASTPGELVAGNAFTSTAEGLGAFVGPFACALVITRRPDEPTMTGDEDARVDGHLHSGNPIGRSSPVAVTSSPAVYAAPPWPTGRRTSSR